MARPVTLFTGQWADLPLEVLAKKAASWGYDGLELACWGDHFEVDKALSDDGYCEAKRELLKDHSLKVFAISTHLVGQAVCDNIDERHKSILPEDIWVDGDPEGVRKRAAKGVINAARAAKKLGVKIVNGFTSSSKWNILYGCMLDVEQVIEERFEYFANVSTLILDELYKCDLQLALQPMPMCGLKQNISKHQSILKGELIPKPHVVSEPRNKPFEFKMHKKVEKYVDKEVTYSLKLPALLSNWVRKLRDCFDLLFAKVLHKYSVR